MDEQPTPPASPHFSLAGWNWKTFLVKNKEGLKWGIALLVAYLGVLVISVEPPELKAFLVWIVGYGSKVLLNIVDFWLSETPL